MSIIKKSSFFILIFNILTQENYLHSGIDWKSQKCKSISSNQLQSPLDIDNFNSSCLGIYSIELLFDEFAKHSITVSLSGDPQTIRMNLQKDLLTLILRSNSFNTRIYHPLQMIFRTPSEHTKLGKRFPLELQIFFKSKSDERLALAILFDYSNSKASSVIFSDFLNLLNQTKTVNATQNVTGYFNNSFEYNSLFSNNPLFYYYNGSLTDNNCASNYEWIVLAEHLTVSADDVAIYQNILVNLTPSRNNSRMTQSLNSRPIFVGGVNCNDFYSDFVFFVLFILVIFGVVFKGI